MMKKKNVKSTLLVEMKRRQNPKVVIIYLKIMVNFLPMILMFTMVNKMHGTVAAEADMTIK